MDFEGFLFFVCFVSWRPPFVWVFINMFLHLKKSSLYPFFLFENYYHNCTYKNHPSYNQKCCLSKFLSGKFHIHPIKSCNHCHQSDNYSQYCKDRDDGICFDISRSIVDSRNRFSIFHCHIDSRHNFVGLKNQIFKIYIEISFIKIYRSFLQLF